MASDEINDDDQTELIGNTLADDSAVVAIGTNDERLLFVKVIDAALLATRLATEDLVDTDDDRREATTDAADDIGVVTSCTCAQK